MIRVALETATSFGTVAVGRGDRVLAEVGLGVQARHAESLVPALESALALAGVGREDLEEVVIGAGPGSFTGVRIAGATAKGLVAGLALPLIAYPSLLALAAGVPSDRPVCALFDARRGEVYGGCWRVDARAIVTVLDPTVGTVEDVVEATRSAAPLFVGDGALRYHAELAAAVDSGAAAGEDPGTERGSEPGMERGSEPGAEPPVAPGAPAYPRASVLLWLAEHHPTGARVDDIAGWQPLYLRGSSAERGVAG